MDTQRRFRGWGPALAGLMALLAAPARAEVRMDGTVTLDYYVADVDDDGFEYTDADLYVERVSNPDTYAWNSLALSGWFTGSASPAGDGDEVGYLPVPLIPGSSSYGPVADTVPAHDVAPGEYYAHVLLQDDAAPGTFEDARSLAPRVLWRGGLEAVGPLYVVPYAGGTDVTVDFAQLRNNRLDSRITNDIELTLYATSGFGPASAGYTLCRRRVPGLYAGDRDDAPDFDCTLGAVPDGEYTLHLEVAEVGGRGGSSTLSGPDVTFRGGRVDDGAAAGYTELYVAGALGEWAVLLLALVALGRIALAQRAPRAVRVSAAGPGSRSTGSARDS